MNFKLQKNNKYVGKRIKKTDSNITQKIISGVLSGALIGSILTTFLIPKLTNEKVSNITISTTSALLNNLDTYNTLTKEEKEEYVIELFKECIDKNDNFKEEDKTIIKNNIIPFLSSYGYLYDYDTLKELEAALLNITLTEKDNLTAQKGVLGEYYPSTNLIVMDSNSTDEKTLLHEVTHAISIFTTNYNHIISEGITSCIDKEFYNHTSYNDIIKNQIIFLSEIIGRENLLKCYLNSDYETIKELIGEEGEELYSLFNIEYSIYRNDNETMEDINDIYEECANKLKEIYESQTKTKVTEDAIINAIYTSCLPNSDYKLTSCLFYENKFEFQYNNTPIIIDTTKRKGTFQTIDDYINNMTNSDLEECINTISNDLYNDYITNTNNTIITKLNLLLGQDTISSLFTTPNLIETLKQYLEETYNITSLKIIYKLLTNNYTKEDFITLYSEEFKKLYENEELGIIQADLYLLTNPEERKTILEELKKYDVNNTLDIYKGFYWEYRLSNDLNNSILCYNNVTNENTITLPDIMEYIFIDNKGNIIYPEYTTKENNYLEYDLSKYKEVYIIGNPSKYTYQELEIPTSKNDQNKSK